MHINVTFERWNNAKLGCINHEHLAILWIIHDVLSISQSKRCSFIYALSIAFCLKYRNNQIVMCAISVKSNQLRKSDRLSLEISGTKRRILNKSKLFWRHQFLTRHLDISVFQESDKNQNNIMSLYLLRVLKIDRNFIYVNLENRNLSVVSDLLFMILKL